MKPLTPRESEIIELLAMGLAQKEIANHLEISVATVDTLIRKAKERLNLQKSTELVAWYYIRKYKLTLNLSPVAKAIVAAVMLTIAAYSLVIENSNMLRVMRPARSARSARGRRGRRNEFDFETDFYYEDYLKLAS